MVSANQQCELTALCNQYPAEGHRVLVTGKNMIDNGRLPAVKIGRDWRIERSEVLAMLEARGDTARQR